MKRAKKSNRVRIEPSALRRWVLAGTVATTAAGAALLLTFARLQAGRAVWADGFYLNGDQWFDAARTTVTLVGIIGLGGAAFLAYRRQVSTEASHLLEQSSALRGRYTTAAEQLGHDSAAIRLAGVYALASLADDWHEFGNDDERQVCVDLLCAYLRTQRADSAVEPRAATSAARALAGRRQSRLIPAPGEKRIGYEEKNVRSAIIGVIATRTLKPGAWKGMKGPWGGLRFALDGADLSDADLPHADLSDADLSGANLIEANLNGANLSSASLIGTSLVKADLSGAYLVDANLLGADLAGADLIDASLSHASLINASLCGADLAGVELIGAKLTGAKLTGADLIRADLTGANLTRAELSAADLTRANLTRADLTRADLTRADLTGADLTDADLTGADLTDADLTGADLTDADLTDARWTADTKWPEGFVPPESSTS